MAFWKIKNLAENKGELILYGEISESSWWGDEITPKQFADDLKNLGDVDSLDVRINSPGGDVFAAYAIMNQLKSHKANVNVYIDGLAASAATIVAMAGDTINIPSSAMMMVHDPMVVLWGAYNTKDFQEMTDFLEKIKESIVNAYFQRTKISKEDLSNMMSEETWMTGEEAIEKGFADSLTDVNVDLEVQVNSNNKFLVVNNHKFDMGRFKNMPKIPQRQNARQAEPQGTKNNMKGVQDLKLEDFKNQFPDLFKEVKDIGAKEERQRIQDIENVALPGYEKLVQNAKFEKITDAATLSMEIIKNQKETGKRYLNDAAGDAAEMEDVEPTGEPKDAPGGEQAKNEANLIVNFFKNKRR